MIKKDSFANKIDWLRKRELGVFPRGYFADDDLKNVLYRSIRKNPLETSSGIGRLEHGGVFGLDFSPDGSVLVAACERKTFLLFDSLTQKTIRNVDYVHSDCVNVVKFLDDRLFVTCSDDTTAKLWDLRFVKDRAPVRSFKGHTAWVKNIDYIPNEGTLLTSAFDDFIYAWEINKYRENQQDFKRVFHTRGLIRMCLSEDRSKMIISTQWGYLFVVHNFDLSSFVTDFETFKPNVCWMMLKIPNEPLLEKYRTNYRRRFCGSMNGSDSRNVPELIVDFPDECEPNNVTSVTPHPFDWCLLSRCTDHTNDTEWSCIHDIQLPPVELLDNGQNSTSTQREGPSQMDDDSGLSLSDLPPALIAEVVRRRRPMTMRMSAGGAARPIPRNFVNVIRRLSQEYSLDNEHESAASPTPNSPQISFTPTTYHRLTHCIQETNVGRGFIKEQSFSLDGRVVASPFGYGVRLLAFDVNCSELSAVSPLRVYEPKLWKDRYNSRQKDTRKRGLERGQLRTNAPVLLTEVGFNVSHTSPVLCAKFSPTDQCLLATGCYNGKVAFYQPVL